MKYINPFITLLLPARYSRGLLLKKIEFQVDGRTGKNGEALGQWSVRVKRTRCPYMFSQAIIVCALKFERFDSHVTSIMTIIITASSYAFVLRTSRGLFIRFAPYATYNTIL
jgi:hypothetical protein